MITKEGVRGFIIDLIPNAPDGYNFRNYSRFTHLEQRTIPPNGHNDLLVALFNSNKKEHVLYRKDLRSFLKDTKLILKYTDIYGTHFEQYVTDCSWYGRYVD